MITENGIPIIIDFGLAKHYDPEGGETSGTLPGRSKGFSPVELYKEGGVNRFSPQTDVYSLSATLYNMLTGIVPPSALEIDDDPITFQSTIPTYLISAISKGMSGKRTERYSTITEFLDSAIPEGMFADREDDMRSEEETSYSDEVVMAETISDEDEYYNRGVEAYNKGDYETALKIFRILAEKGNVEAQAYLGIIYYNGECVEKNYKEAVKWLTKAAEKCNIAANFLLALMYYNGEGVEQDYLKAGTGFFIGASLGNMPSAQYYLGRMLFNGEGVKKNYEQALEWFRKSADQGQADAQNHLGAMYYDACGVHKDYNEALKWFYKSAVQGNADAQFNMGLLYENGHGVKRDEIEAISWYQKAAENGHEAALERLRASGMTG